MKEDGKIRVYLDACILISFFSKDQREKDNKEKVKKIIDGLFELKAVEYCISSLVVAETVNILLNNHHMSNEEVWDIESTLITRKRFGKLRLKILSPEDELQGDYDFEDFIYDIRKITLKYHPGFADAMHIVIMKNNDVKYILTFNPKDFENVEGLVVVKLENFLNKKE